MKKIIGYGGKGGGHVATEADNTLRSSQEAEVVEVLSEGEIVGFVDIAGNLLQGDAIKQAVYLDGVPLVNANGTENFNTTEMVLDYTLGTQSQPSLASEADGGIRTTLKPANTSEIKNSNPGVTQVITNPDGQVRGIELLLGVPALYKQSKGSGDTIGTSVDIKVSLKIGTGSFVQFGDIITIDGKTTARFQYPVYIAVDGAALQYTVLIERITEDRTQTVQVDTDWVYQDKVYLDAYTVIRTQAFNYPNSAVVKMRIKSDQFSSIPERSYLIKGIKVKVPSNYDASASGDRFPGIWNGTFTTAWTDNPAWIYYDLLTNTRYGIGDVISPDQIDKWALYEIGKYCDGLVPDGQGGSERRFTCNAWFTSQQDIYTFLNSITSIFRGMQFWANSQLICRADMPKDPVAHFTYANVVDGIFNYSGTSLKTRHTSAHVVWNDPADFYRQRIEVVEDLEAIKKWGLVKADVTAVGCTSRGQAHRLGKWLLYSEHYETETVSFKAALDAAILMPGDIIETIDPDRNGERLGGRIVAVNGNQLTLDAAVPDGSYSISLLTEDTSDTTRENAPKLEVISGTASGSTFTLSTAPSFTVKPNQVWTLVISGDVKERWRVIDIKESEPGIVQISGLEYRADKFSYVEQNLKLGPKPGNGGSNAGNIGVDKPQFLLGNFKEYLYYSAPGVLSTGLTTSWTGNSPKYVLRYKLASGANWTPVTTDVPTYDIKPIDPGLYDFEVYGINNQGVISETSYIQYTVLGKTALPSDVASIQVEYNVSGSRVTWDVVPDIDLKHYELRRLTGVLEGGVPDQNTWHLAEIVTAENLVTDPFVGKLAKIAGVVKQYYPDLTWNTIPTVANLDIASFFQKLVQYGEAYYQYTGSSWEPIQYTQPASQVNSYTVYSNNGNFYQYYSTKWEAAEPIAEVIGTTFTDTSYTFEDPSVWYFVKAVDTSNRFSNLFPYVNYVNSDVLAPDEFILNEYKTAGTSGAVIHGITATWTPSASLNIASYVIEGKLSTEDTSAWKTLVTVDGQTTTVLISPVTVGVVYQLRIRAVTGAGTVSPWFQANDFFVSAIDAPNALTASVAFVAQSSGASLPVIQLTWDASTDPNVANYQIETKFDGDANWISVATVGVADLRYNFQNPVMGRAYEFRIRAITSTGAYSSWTQALDVTYAALGAPATLTITSLTKLQGDGSYTDGLSVGWSSVANAVGYDVQYKLSTDTNYIDFGRVTTTLVELVPLVKGLTYNVRVRAVSVTGQLSAWKAGTGTPAGDTVAPGPVTGLTATGGYGNILVTWTNPTDLDYAFTEIYVSSASGTSGFNTATKLGEVSGTSLLHTGFTSATTRYYWARAVDYTGNRSAWTPLTTAQGVAGTSASTSTVDTTPPGTTTGVSGTTTNVVINGTEYTNITVTWTANPATDLAYYEVAIAETATTISTEPTNYVIYMVSGGSTSYTFAVKPATRYWIKVRAVDTSENKAGTWTYVSANKYIDSAADTTAPGVPTGLAVTAAMRTAFLSWTNPTGITDLDKIEIYAVQNDSATEPVFSSNYLIATVNAIPGQKGGFTHSNLTPTKRYWYWLKARDTSGNQSAATTGVSADTAQILTVDIGENQITTPLLVANAITADKIAAATITGDKISTSTSLPGTITVGATGVEIGTIQQQSIAIGNPTNTPTIGSVVYTAEANGAVVATVTYSYTQGTIPADNLIILVQSGGSDPTLASPGVVIAAATVTNGTQRIAVAPSTVYKFSIVAQRKDAGGLKYTPSTLAVTAPGTSSAANYTATIAGTTAATIRDNAATGAQDPAIRINSGTTTIDPGKILITGSTTLADWRKAGDLTKIDGGSISTNTIDANKLTVGNRGISVENITFLPANTSLTRRISSINNSGTASTTLGVASTTLRKGLIYAAVLYYPYPTGGSETLKVTSHTGAAASAAATSYTLEKALDPNSGFTISSEPQQIVTFVPIELNTSVYSNKTVDAANSSIATLALNAAVPLAPTHARMYVEVTISNVVYRRYITNTTDTDSTTSITLSSALPSTPANNTSVVFGLEAPYYNTIAWTNGVVKLLAADGTPSSKEVHAGWSATAYNYSSPAPIYVYHDESASAVAVSGSITTYALKTTTTTATAFGATNAVLATYNGYALVTNNYGKTVIDGSQIITGTLKADQIDTRNLEIKDQYGNVIFSAGNKLAPANITPDSGWLNSQISINSSGYLVNAGTGQVTFAGLGGGELGKINSITSGNAATYIANAAIGSAQIGTVNANQVNAATLSAITANTGSLQVNNTLTVVNGGSLNVGNITGGTSGITSGGGFKVQQNTSGQYQVWAGSASTNMTVSTAGTLYLNGEVVATGNLKANSVSYIVSNTYGSSAADGWPLPYFSNPTYSGGGGYT